MTNLSILLLIAETMGKEKKSKKKDKEDDAPAEDAGSGDEGVSRSRK